MIPLSDYTSGFFNEHHLKRKKAAELTVNQRSDFCKLLY
jgi:hypothetical protein